MNKFDLHARLVRAAAELISIRNDAEFQDLPHNERQYITEALMWATYARDCVKHRIQES